MQNIPIQKLIDKFDATLIKNGYKKKGLKNYRIFWKQILTYFQQQQQPYFSEQVALKFLDERYNLTEVQKVRPLTRNETYVRQMVRKLVYFQMHESIGRMNGIAERQVNNKEFLNVLSAYTIHCLQHGYASSTRTNLREDAVKFFLYLETHSIQQCSSITEMNIIQYINSFKQHYAYRSIGVILTDLRNFLSFLHSQGFHEHNLCEVLPHQQLRQTMSIPTVWSHNDVQKLLQAIDRGNPCGKRDYAIFLLVARLGIRAGDVRTLKLENLNWNMNTIEFIQSKTGQSATLPLLKDVGWAIIDYLKNGRPQIESPFVFLRHLPPFDKVHDRNCFYHIVRRCIRISQVIPPGDRKLGMHSLRHTLATTMLTQNIPLTTIAGVLGHTSVESTSTYLRTDIAALRGCTLDEPEILQ